MCKLSVMCIFSNNEGFQLHKILIVKRRHTLQCAFITATALGYVLREQHTHTRTQGTHSHLIGGHQ